MDYNFLCVGVAGIELLFLHPYWSIYIQPTSLSQYIQLLYWNKWNVYSGYTS